MELDQSVIDKLPAWASFVDGVIQVDPSQAYPEYLKLFEMEPDKYSVEAARRCMTLDLLDITGPGIMIKIMNPAGPDGQKINERWAFKNLQDHPEYGDLSISKGSMDGVRLHNQLKKNG